MRLKDPWFLLFLLVYVPLIWIYIRRERGKRATVKFSDLSMFSRIPVSPLVRWRHATFILKLLGIACLVVALARPQKGVSEEEVTTEGVDIMLLLDVSTSMKALDFTPKNRLFVAKETIADFITKRSSDRIGLVCFAGRAYTKCPLTLDYSILTQFLEQIDFGEVEDGTAIGTAIATAANRLKDSPAKSRVVILLTDGRNNRGDIAPITAAEAAGKLGIKIYTIGIGKDGQVPYPFEVADPFTGKIVGTQVQMIPSDLDEASLQEIAAKTGGQFFRAQNAEKLKEIYTRIDALEKTQIKTKSFTTYTEHFYPWALWGSAFLLLEFLLASTWFRRIP